MAGGKRIAVVVRDRQAEGIRMGVGLSVLHSVDLYVLDNMIGDHPDIAFNLTMAGELSLKVVSNMADESGTVHLPTEEIGRRLLEYDAVLCY